MLFLSCSLSLCLPCRKRTYRVIVGEDETEAIYLIEIQGVGVEDPNVNLPFFKVVGFDQVNARREIFGLWTHAKHPR